MIADIYVQLPFSLAIPSGVQFEAPQYEEQDGTILTIYPPVRTDLPGSFEYKSLEVDGREAFAANAMRFSLRKTEFRRDITGVAPDDKELQGIPRPEVFWKWYVLY